MGEPRFSAGGVCPPVTIQHVTCIWPGFTVKGLRRRCARKHRNNRRESAGWGRKITKRCLIFVEMARAGSADNVLPAPFNFRGCGLRGECLLAREVLRTATIRVRFPAAAPMSRQAGHQRAVESPKLRRSGAAPERLANRGRGRQAMHLPCKQAHAGALPADSTNFTAGRMRFR